MIEKVAPRCGAKHISKSKCTKHTMLRTTFGSCECRKSARRCGAKHISNSNVKSTTCSRHFWTFRCRFAWQAQGIVHLVKSDQNVQGFVAFPKTMAGEGHLNRICKDAFSVASAVQETCSSELLGGPGTDFLRGVAFWSLRSSGLLR